MAHEKEDPQAGYCSSCGAKLTGNTKFCLQCGHKIGEQPAKKRGPLARISRFVLITFGILMLLGLVGVALESSSQENTATQVEQPQPDPEPKPEPEPEPQSKPTPTPPPPAPEPDNPAAGDWSGTFLVTSTACNGFGGTWNATVDKEGSTTGDYRAVYEGYTVFSGDFSGTVNNGSWNVSGGGGDVNFVGTVNGGNSVSGTFTGPPCPGGGTTNGTFSGSKS